MAINDPNKWSDHVSREKFAASCEVKEEAAKAARLAHIKSLIGKPDPGLKRKIDCQVGIKPEPSIKEAIMLKAPPKERKEAKVKEESSGSSIAEQDSFRERLERLFPKVNYTETSKLWK